VLNALRELDLGRKTLVIFTSDNGGTRRGVNLPLRGNKGSTWEGGMRVPTIAWWPGRIPPGTETEAITGMIDILPTLVGLAGGKLPTDRLLDGADIWPVLAGESDARPPHDSFLYYRGLKLEAVRQGPWKLRLVSGELFNLDDDIGESTDVASAHPLVVRQLRKIAAGTRDDLGPDGIGPGCRKLGKVKDARPLIDHDGNIREGFASP
jgi:arylsulfatase A-like enzyme